jgi:toxin secretion/phage lysis holin
MEKITKIILELIPAGYFIWTGQFTGACMILFLLMILDMLTGIRKAQHLKTISSTIWRQKTAKKLLDNTTVILLGYFLNMFFLNVQFDGYIAEFLFSFFGGIMKGSFLIFIGWLVGCETYSILENLAEMGMKVPNKIVCNLSKNLEAYKIEKNNDKK